MAGVGDVFATTVAEGKFGGDFSRCTNRNRIYWLWRKDAPSRHYYVHAAPLPGIDAAPEDVVDFLKRHFEHLFPFGATRSNGNRVHPGATFQIATRTPFPSEITCIAITPYQFIFRAVPNRHALKGEITFGVFRDASGMLWLFQQGLGHPGENVFQLLLTRIMPRFLWRQMRANLLAYWRRERGA